MSALLDGDAPARLVAVATKELVEPLNPVLAVETILSGAEIRGMTGKPVGMPIAHPVPFLGRGEENVGATARLPHLCCPMPQCGHWADTKFLYFVGRTVPSATGPQPLVLDRVLTRRLRSLAETVGRESGHDPDGSIASWVWNRGWSPHRYAVYLSFMHAAARQLAANGSWPSDASPDLLEYALFSTTWQESG
ncbi:hypothetical protein [Streptomyces sp. NPDC060002]|uniref:8-oxoguanine DNA glycosylase OGG fold protein n=1 Tax=Streptomyces sp. NPDC060002 TaxID=3347033 RepID=UPI00367BDC34